MTARANKPVNATAEPSRSWRQGTDAQGTDNQSQHPADSPRVAAHALAGHMQKARFAEKFVVGFLALFCLTICSFNFTRAEAAMDGDWDFYLAKVDDAPASILLDLSLKGKHKHSGKSTLYAVQIDMVYPDHHQMGSSTEMEVLGPIEDAVVEEVALLTLRYIGRLRNNGFWQLTFMGPEAQQESVREIASKHLTPVDRTFEIIAQSDPTWSYYLDFLYPNEERMIWIQDHRVVQALQREGDTLQKPRPVEHSLYFPNSQSRAAFLKKAAALGFHYTEFVSENAERSFGLTLSRVDSVKLEEIHEVTILLTSLAEQFQGAYDGWETTVEK